MTPTRLRVASEPGPALGSGRSPPTSSTSAPVDDPGCRAPRVTGGRCCWNPSAPAATALCSATCPPSGKTHLACAVEHELIWRGRRARFYASYELVQEILAARRGLVLPEALKHLDVYDAVILDDIGYVQQARDEADVLFVSLAER